jgi:DNA polymerase
VTKHRGEVLDLPDSTAKVMATVHPSAVLRAENRDEAFAEFVKDLAGIPVG